MRGVLLLLLSAFLLLSCGDDTVVDSGDHTPPFVEPIQITNACGLARDVVIRITESGSGIDWDSVFIDMYTLAGPKDRWMCRSNLVHTVTPDVLTVAPDSSCDGTTCEIPIESMVDPGDMMELRYVIYGGQRSLAFDDELQCDVFEYDWDSGGVRDLAGNHAPVSSQIAYFGLFICDY